MALKLPPVIVFLFFAGFMYVLAAFLPAGDFDFFGRLLLIKILLASSVLIAVIAMYQFIRAKTTIDPMSPAKVSQLITRGIYNYSRNPMYLSLLLLLLGWGLWLGNAFNTLIAAGFVAYMNKFQIIPEEAVLRQRFGKIYDQYTIRVRRWF